MKYIVLPCVNKPIKKQKEILYGFPRWEFDSKEDAQKFIDQRKVNDPK